MTDWWVSGLLGAGVALALWVAWRALFPPPLSLSAAMERINRPPQLVAESTEASIKRRLGQWLGPVLENTGADLDTVRADARITGTPFAEHLGSKITSAVLGPAAAVAVTALFILADVEIPVLALVAAAVAVSTVGFFGADIVLHHQAEQRREDFVVALSSYLDLVAISMEGGMGWNGAVVEAARVGDGWAFELIRLAIDASNYDNRGVWDGFKQLGDELKVPALANLAANISLAGTEGARVRTSIAGRADTLRQSQLAAIESSEASATERLTIPSVMLLLGFLILVGFPAFYAVATGV